MDTTCLQRAVQLWINQYPDMYTRYQNLTKEQRTHMEAIRMGKRTNAMRQDVNPLLNDRILLNGVRLRMQKEMEINSADGLRALTRKHMNTWEQDNPQGFYQIDSLPESERSELNRMASRILALLANVPLDCGCSLLQCQEGFTLIVLLHFYTDKQSPLVAGAMEAITNWGIANPNVHLVMEQCLKEEKECQQRQKQFSQGMDHTPSTGSPPPPPNI